MDLLILCKLIAERIPSEQFQVHGDKVVFIDPDRNNKPCTDKAISPYDTTANRTIVADVIINYDSLSEAIIALTKDQIEKEELIQEKIKALAEFELKKEGKLDSHGKVVKHI